MKRWLLLIAVAGCTGTIDGDRLRVEPAQLDLALDLEASSTITFRVFDATQDVTADSSFALDGAAVGGLAGPELMVSARTGGTAAVTVTYGDLTASVPVVVKLTSARVDPSAPIEATQWFATAVDTAYDGHLEPGDGAVLPPNLGGFETTFAAEAADDLHEVTVTSEFLRVQIITRGGPGARRVAFTAAEWDAIERTNRAASADLVVRSLSSAAPTSAHRTSSHLAFSDLELRGALLFGAMSTTLSPRLMRYDFTTATAEPWATGPQGGCLGCHVVVSRDGTRIALMTADMVASQGLIIDSTTRYAVNTPDPANAWTSAVFDPSGALITTSGGVMTLRDGTTAAPLATIATPTPATLPTLSPDGATLAYAELDPTSQSTIGKDLRVQSWNAATATLGAPHIVVPPDGRGIKEPSFSSDGQWVLYSRTAGLTSRGEWDGASITRLDASATIPLSTEPTDSLARWAGDIASARTDSMTAEPMAWIVLASERSIAGIDTGRTNAQLWMIAFYPESGLTSRPFLLPNQDRDLGVLHAPQLVPF